MPEWMVGRFSRSIDATSVMWAFFSDHPLQKKQVSGAASR
jgi:poly(3-hydroxybutyrate) depolymerase